MPAAVSGALASITIVGMKYYKDAHEKIANASNKPAPDQLLFLVADVNNKFDQNAVALHDGHGKLGHVSALEAPKVRRILRELAEETGQDQVLVVTHAPVKQRGDFTWATSTNVKVVGHVYERIARKYAQGD